VSLVARGAALVGGDTAGETAGARWSVDGGHALITGRRAATPPPPQVSIAVKGASRRQWPRTHIRGSSAARSNGLPQGGRSVPRTAYAKFATARRSLQGEQFEIHREWEGSCGTGGRPASGMMYSGRAGRGIGI